MNNTEKATLIEIVTNLQKATRDKQEAFKVNTHTNTNNGTVIAIGYQKRTEYLEALIKHAIIILDTEFELGIFDSCNSKE